MLTTDVWKVSAKDFPLSAPREEQLRFLLRYAILAPSVKNTQPWRFTVTGDEVRLYAAWNHDLPVSDPMQRELHVSLGCALENLLVAAERFGLAAEVRYAGPDAEDHLVASVTLAPGAPTPARSGASLEAIVTRHNDNSRYRPTQVPEEHCRRLEECVWERDLRLDLIDDERFRRLIEAFTAEVDRQEFADPDFRAELGYWVGQGSLGTPGLRARIAGMMLAHLDLGESVAQQDHGIVQSAPLLGVISATADTHREHVRAGQLFERVWLTATGLGINLHPMSQTLRHPALRHAVAQLLPAAGWLPQQLFRVGYSPRARPRVTPRHPLREVLLAPQGRSPAAP